MKIFKSPIRKKRHTSYDPVWILQTTSEQTRGRESDTSESSVSRNLFGEWIELTPEQKDQKWKKIDGRFELVKLDLEMKYLKNYKGLSVYGNGLRCEEDVYYLKSLQDKTVHKVLGSGMESEVYEVEANSTMNSTRVQTGKKYALKVYKKPDNVEFEIEALENNLDFQNLLTPLLCFMVTTEANGPPSPSYLSILYDKFDHDLYDEIDKISTLKDDTNLLLQFSRDLFNGVKEIHDMGFLHNDIKPENIGVVVDSFGRKTLKLCDFGLCTRQLSVDHESRVYDTTQFRSVQDYALEDNAFRGSMAYVPLDENMKEGRLLKLFDRDAFSSICVITVMCTFHFPFGHSVQDFRSDIQSLETQILNLKREIRDASQCPDEIKQLILNPSCFFLVDERGVFGMNPQSRKKFLNMSTERCIEILNPPPVNPTNQSSSSSSSSSSQSQSKRQRTQP